MLGAVAGIITPAMARAGGEGGIRTPDTVARMPHFECGAFNHSATSPWSRVRGDPATRDYVANARDRDKVGPGALRTADAAIRRARILRRDAKRAPHHH